METVLELLKIDLGIMHDKRDAYFTALLSGCQSELNGRGVNLDLTSTEDQMLLADYALWRYRKREENAPMAQNLQWRIRNKKMKGRIGEGATSPKEGEGIP